MLRNQVQNQRETLPKSLDGSVLAYPGARRMDPVDTPNGSRHLDAVVRLVVSPTSKARRTEHLTRGGDPVIFVDTSKRN